MKGKYVCVYYCMWEERISEGEEMEMYGERKGERERGMKREREGGRWKG